MRKFIQTLMMVAALAVGSSSFAQSSDVKVLFVGDPQSGPPVILAQAYAKSLKVPATFVTMKDCASAQRFIEKNPNVVFFVSDLTTMTHKRRGENCVPSEFKPANLIGTMSSAWHLCRKPGGKDITPGTKFTVGLTSILPGAGIVKDMNTLNNLNGVYVGVATSNEVTQSVLNGDLDWGMINPGIAEPLVKQGKLDCAYTFIQDGTDVVGKDRLISKFFKFTTSSFKCTYFAVAKSENKAMATELDRAARSAEFKEFLVKSDYFLLRSGQGKFAQSDIDRFNSDVDSLINNYYK